MEAIKGVEANVNTAGLVAETAVIERCGAFTEGGTPPVTVSEV